MEKKSSGIEQIKGLKKSRSKSKTFKSLTLATLLIILPFGLYWYIQVDQHKDYEQQKIYRTLHELDRHINNEIKALTQIKNVLPKKEQLTSVSELKPEQYNRIDSCGYKILEKTKLSGILGLSNNEKSSCYVSDGFLTQAQNFLNSELEKYDFDLEKAQNLFFNQIVDANQYVAETRQLMVKLTRKYQADIDLLCQRKNISRSSSSSQSCNNNHNIEKMTHALKSADSMKDVLRPTFTIYKQCYEQHGSRYTRKVTKGFHLACNEFMTSYEYIIDDIATFSNTSEVFEQEPEKTIERVLLAFNQMLDAMTEIEEIINYKLDQNLMADEQNTGNNYRERLVSRNAFNQNLLEPYQRLVSRSQVCMFVSEQQNDMKVELALLSNKQFKALFGSSWQDCKEVLQGESILLHRTSWLDNNQAVDELKQNLWLAVGLETVMRRYREQLKYMQDIYLVSGDGRIVSSFIQAKNQLNVGSTEQRVINLSPIFSSLDRMSKDEVTLTENGSPANDQTIRVYPGDLKVDIVQESDKKNSHQTIIAWPIQASMEIEANEYLAMIKPMATMISTPVMSPDSIRLKDTPLLLVGIKANESSSLFTARLSPLFHFTVLFIVLVLILTMPIFHILLAKTRNSYTLRTVRLYGLAVVLVVVAGSIGIAGYYTMLKQSIFSTQHIVVTADRLLSEWIKERDANIRFLKKAEQCLFSKYYDSPLDHEKQSSDCYPEFKKLKEYKNYHPSLSDDPFATPDTFVYKVKNALPMMGLLFFTDSDAIKQQPDWMAREFIPLKKDEIDLSGRQYYQSLSVFDAWQTTTEKIPYFVERIYNYIDGRKVTQLAVPKNHKAYQENAAFSGIISGEILALSLEQPILPPGMRFAVVETQTGKVMFHSERERALVENYYKEIDGNANFKEAVKAGSDAMDIIVYRSEKLLAYSTKVPDTQWSLILTYNHAPAHSMVNEVAVGSLIAVLFLLLLILVVVTLYRKFFEIVDPKISRLREMPISEHNYLEKWCRTIDLYRISWQVKDFYIATSALCILFVAVTFLLMHSSLTSALVWCFFYMLVMLFLTLKSKVNTPDKVTNTGQWIRLNPVPLCYFLLLWIGVPSLFIFARWYDLTAHQLESYDYLELKQNIEKRSDFIDKHRNTLWYGDKKEPRNHWFDKQQETLGIVVDHEINKGKRKLYFSDMLPNSSSFLEKKQSEIAGDNNKLYVINEPESFVFDYTNLSFCFDHRNEEHRGEHGLWKSIPLLSHLSRIAYSVEGQRCLDENDKDYILTIDSGNFFDIFQLEFSETFVDESTLSRVKVLDLSRSLIFLLIILFIVALFVYCRILIKGIWHSYWLNGEPLIIRKSLVYSMPHHRMFINSCSGFIRNLLQQSIGDVSVKDNKYYVTLKETGSGSSTREQEIFLYPSIDLLSMEPANRLDLLAELESLVYKKDTVIWMTVDIPPLYRLVKQRAYPHDENSLELSSHEILRWSNIFKLFYKDYHTGQDDKIEAVLNQPVLKKYEAVTRSQTNRWLCQETAAFAPDLLWIKDTILREHDCTLNLDNIQRLTAIYAGAYYRYKWEKCTADERLLLYQVASNRYPCSKNNEVIEHLLRRGYLVTKPLLKICNESFKEFILNAELQEVFDDWQSEAEQSGWQQLRIYVGVLVILILAWLAYTSNDTYQQLAYVIGSLLTVFTALTQGANLLKLGKGSKE